MYIPPIEGGIRNEHTATVQRGLLARQPWRRCAGRDKTGYRGTAQGPALSKVHDKIVEEVRRFGMLL